MKNIKCFVSCRDINGSPEVVPVIVRCADTQYSGGDHYDAAEGEVKKMGYDPMFSCDEDDPAFCWFKPINWQMISRVTVRASPASCSREERAAGPWETPAQAAAWTLESTLGQHEKLMAVVDVNILEGEFGFTREVIAAYESQLLDPQEAVPEGFRQRRLALSALKAVVNGIPDEVIDTHMQNIVDRCYAAINEIEAEHCPTKKHHVTSTT
tara:strand:- start:88 stop:720 length:633 start_codon:yes stop_codon:yes gene_type:complete